MRDLLLSGSVAASQDSGSHLLRTGVGPTGASRWGRLSIWIALIVAAAFVGWRYHASHANFPRRESDFLSAAAIDSRLEKLNQRLHDNPDDLSAMVESGILRFQKGPDNYTDAINELHDAWVLGALDVRIFYYTGVMYQQLGVSSKFAIEQYENFLRNRPDDVEVRLLVAKLLYQAGIEKAKEKGHDKDQAKDIETERDKDFEDAAAQYQHLKVKLPRNPIVVENLALSLQALNRFDEAKQELENLKRFGPEEARRAHLYLAQIASQQADAPTAMREYLQILPLDGRSDLGTPPAKIYQAIAENYDVLKAPVLAKEFWDKTIELDPKNRKAQNRIPALKKQLAKKRPAPAKSRKK